MCDKEFCKMAEVVKAIVYFNVDLTIDNVLFVKLKFENELFQNDKLCAALSKKING